MMIVILMHRTKKKLDTFQVDRIMNIVPIRSPVRWKIEDGRAVLVYKKNFTRLEKWLYKHLGGTEYIRRPLDEMGTDVWLLCNGRHTVREICDFMRKKYLEKIEPVQTRVWAFIQTLAMRNLLILANRKMPKGIKNRSPNKAKKRERFSEKSGGAIYARKT